RPQIGFPLLMPAHVIDGEDDDGINARLADPLRRDQLRKSAMRVIWVDLVEIREAIAVGGGGDGDEEERWDQDEAHGGFLMLQTLWRTGCVSCRVARPPLLLTQFANSLTLNRGRRHPAAYAAGSPLIMRSALAGGPGRIVRHRQKCCIRGRQRAAGRRGS